MTANGYDPVPGPLRFPGPDFWPGQPIEDTPFYRSPFIDEQGARFLHEIPTRKSGGTA